jgi:hypothetical protein
MKEFSFKVPVLLGAAIIILLFFFLLGSFAYGVAAQRFRLFPYGMFAEIETALTETVEVASGQPRWYYNDKNPNVQSRLWPEVSETAPLNLVTGMMSDYQISVLLVDMAGEVRNEWRIDWFDIWPDATHLPPNMVPKNRPGTHVHGVAMLPGGDIVFNFEQLGMVRMTPCGEVVWKLPYRTHHSVFLDNDGNIWASGHIGHAQSQARLPSHEPPFVEPTVLKISSDGEILEEISLLTVFLENDLRAYMYLVPSKATDIVVTGDRLHLNDVEVFQPPMPEGIFKHGDIMVSFRNISTVLVFDPETLAVRFLKTGGFMRQHDPDFIDGNTISVFDNNHYTSAPDHVGKSRIVIVDGKTGSTNIWYEGSEDEPFFTGFMGKHQWLDDGHMLVTESLNGRGFELDGDKNILWEYVNIVAEDTVGLMEEVQRLDASFTPLFNKSQADRCNK